MPTYDFKCDNGHVFEIFFKTIFDPVKYKQDIFCPTCFAKAKRIYSKNIAGWVLVGAGWANDNYGNKMKPKEKK